MAGVGAVAVGAATEHRLGFVRRWVAGVVARSVAVFDIPVIGPRGRIGVFDLVYNSFVWVGFAIVGLSEHRYVIRRHGRLAARIAVPKRIAVSEHNVIRARSAVDGLVEVVAHRVAVSKTLEVRGVPLLNVVETERR